MSLNSSTVLASASPIDDEVLRSPTLLGALALDLHEGTPDRQRGLTNVRNAHVLPAQGKQFTTPRIDTERKPKNAPQRPLSAVAKNRAGSFGKHWCTIAAQHASGRRVISVRASTDL
jgi:hypothetical protein